ncbi:universal stress protein [Hydrogenophaga sp. BPS33]|uniref:universal stress protein n=1 Tax=Hydrogenophaga sp. BPS33 TaxID=2651974 RepID=UPI00131F8A25|nr:universal stress protein [Hydrogenophaga sp. BPS33]QHE86130.1 universal stress protein [Hydrogenophaga sp. BPS33]
MYKRILVPVDGSPTSDQALDAAIDLALSGGGHLRLVHALDEPLWLAAYGIHGRTGAGLYDAMRDSGHELLQACMEKAQSAGVETDMMLLDKPGVRLGEAVAQAAKRWNADLVVLGSHGRRGFHRAVLGSGAEEVIRQAPVPVLVVRCRTGVPAAT